MNKINKKHIIVAALLLTISINFSACKKEAVPPTDAEILVNKVDLLMPTQDRLDIDQMLTWTAGYDMYFLSGASFGSISEFIFSKNTSERKLVYTTASLFDNITNLQQLKASVNNSTSTSRGADTTYSVEQGFANLESPFYSFKTDKGKLVMIKIHSFTVPELDKRITILSEK